ncbi:MAG: hypothetical protein LIO99_07175 [Clostridiales bacterium]|nr:hypothetical protein [Clostridiales bacterium]
MGYDDDDYEEYYEYDDRVEPVSLVAEYFSERELTDTLMDAGLISERTPKYVGNMEKLVFVVGEDSEVYSPAEIEFTERIQEVFVYPDFYKNMTQGKNMVCRIVAAKIDSSDVEAPMDCLFFEKIIDKALEGFNVFFFVAENSVFFGCRVFDKTDNRDCALSYPISSETKFRYVLEELSLLADMDTFMEYYDHIKYVIAEGQESMEDYDAAAVRRRGMQFSYLDDIETIGRRMGIDVSGEMNRYWNMFQDGDERTFDFLLEEAFDNLAFITSNRVNTYEMLFEADEMVRQAEETEAENERLVHDMMVDSEKSNEEPDEEANALLDDPEKMIKLLKKRRGI